MDKKKIMTKKRVWVPTQKMRNLQSSPPPNEQSGCFAFLRWEDGYTGKIFRGSDIMTRDEAPVQLQDLHSGDPVLAKWSDGKFYSATVEYISREDQVKAPQGHPTAQESFLNMLKDDKPPDSTSESDTIPVDRSPLSEHGEKILELDPSPEGAHAKDLNTAGPPPYGSTKGGTIGPSYGDHTPSPSPYGLNTSGPSPGGSFAAGSSPHDVNTSGPSPSGGHAAGPPAHQFNQRDSRKASLMALDRRDTGSLSNEGNIPYGQRTENAWTPCDGCKVEFEKILLEKRRVNEAISRIDPGQLRELQSLFKLIREKHSVTPSSPSDQQELFPGSGIFISPFCLAAINHASKPNCMRLFHALFDHFFTVEECQNAVPFGRHGSNPLGKEGKRVLDNKKVDGILTYVLRCASLPGWQQVEEAKLKKAFINKCRARAGSKE